MRQVLRFCLVFFVCIAAFACKRADEGGAQNNDNLQKTAAPVVIVHIDEELNAANQARLAKAVRVARETPGSCLIIGLDSPGGNIETMSEMGQTLREAVSGNSSMTTVAFVKSGRIGGAWSAASFLAIACQKLYMETGSRMGSALPVVSTAFGVATADPFADGKYVSMLAARFREYAKQTGRSEAIAAAFVDPVLGVARVRLEDGEEAILGSDELNYYKLSGKKFTVLREYQQAEASRPLEISAAVAFETGFSQGTVGGMADLLNTLGRDSSPIINIDPFPGERFVAFVSSATPILLLLGIILGFLEAKIPGFGLAGVLSTLCFGLVFYGRYLLGAAEILHGVLFVLGLALIAVEIFLAPGTLYAGVLGGVLMVMSLAMAFFDPLIPHDALDAAFLTKNLAWGSGIFLVSVFCMFLLSKFLPHTPILKRMILIPPKGVLDVGAAAHEILPSVGERASAATDLRPAGMIEWDGRRIDAVAEGSFITKGTSVQIVDVSANRIIVIADRGGEIL